MQVYGNAHIYSADSIQLGLWVRVKPYILVPVSKSFAASVLLPVAVPGEIIRITEEAGKAEYVIVRYDASLAEVTEGHTPWQFGEQLHLVSRNEVHAMDCGCAPCSGFPA